jgi:hypothetical protein
LFKLISLKLIKLVCELIIKNPNEEKLTILIGNIVQNEAKTIKQLDLKNMIPKIVQNIKVGYSFN